jgi:hypothetical protein
MENDENLRDEELCTYVSEQVPDVGDLCRLLEIDSYDVCRQFLDVVKEMKYKFTLPECTDGVLDDDDQEEPKLEEWYLEPWDSN